MFWKKKTKVMPEVIVFPTRELTGIEKEELAEQVRAADKERATATARLDAIRAEISAIELSIAPQTKRLAELQRSITPYFYLQQAQAQQACNWFESNQIPQYGTLYGGLGALLGGAANESYS